MTKLLLAQYKGGLQMEGVLYSANVCVCVYVCECACVSHIRVSTQCCVSVRARECACVHVRF